MFSLRHLSAFTLIELLIVVAIISILATIALPNFIEAQTRAKVSRAHAEMRTIATALESFAVDNGSYPPSISISDDGTSFTLILPMSARLAGLTHPVRYLTHLSDDIFSCAKGAPGLAPLDAMKTYDCYSYLDRSSASSAGAYDPSYTRDYAYMLASAGPDLYQACGIIPLGGVDYDATNGTRSQGDIVRLGSR